MVRWLRIDVAECDGLPAIVGDESRTRVVFALGGMQYSKLITGKSNQKQKKTPWAPGGGRHPTWSADFGEAAQSIVVDDDEDHFREPVTKYVVSQQGDSAQVLGAGYRTGARVELRVDSNGYGADDEDHYDDLRGGLTVSVVTKNPRTLDVLTRTKEVAATVVSGSDLVTANGRRMRYGLRDSKGNKAGTIVMAISLVPDDHEATPVIGSEDNAVAHMVSSSSASPQSSKTSPDTRSSMLDGPRKIGRDSSSRDDVDGASAGTSASAAHVLFNPFDGAPDPSAELREQMAKIVCPLCRQVFADPVILGNCRHAICRRCIWEQVGDGKQRLMTCPSCSVSYNLGYSGTMGLTQARHVHPELRAAGFMQNCNKMIPPSNVAALPPQMQPHMAPPANLSALPPTMQPQQASAGGYTEQMFTNNPFSSAAPTDPNDVFARMNAQVAVRERERQRAAAQRGANGGSEDVVKPEFSGMGSHWAKP